MCGIGGCVKRRSLLNAARLLQEVSLPLCSRHLDFLRVQSHHSITDEEEKDGTRLEGENLRGAELQKMFFLFFLAVNLNKNKV